MDDQAIETIRSQFGDRYRILEVMATGSMSTVLLAHDPRHDRKVVVKVLRPDLAAHMGIERFRREIRIAGQLVHPNILGLIDSGSVGDTLYYVMPFVEGETLRRRMNRVGRLSVAETTEIARSILEGLSFAHSHGFVHRDLKPENILLVGRTAMLLDFGVAKMLRESFQAEGITVIGTTVGTPAYMAPEQALGRPDVDHRVDIYSIGVLLYEMLAGRLPHNAGTAEDMMHAITADPIVPIETFRTDLPISLTRVIRKCLRKDPVERYDKASFLAEDLSLVPTGQLDRGPTVRRRGTIAAGIVVLVALAFLWFSNGNEGAVEATDLVAVAPFVNETTDSSLTAVAHMAGDWITQGLQNNRAVSVVPWPVSLEAYENSLTRSQSQGTRFEPISALASETGARIVVTGTLYRTGDQLQFQLQVADASDGSLLQAVGPVSAPVDEAVRGVVELRDRLMAAMAIREDTRSAAIPGIMERPPTIEAYQAFHRGLNLHNDQRYREALPEFHLAYSTDTTFLVARIYEAVQYLNIGEYEQVDSTVAFVDARRARLSPYHREILDYVKNLVRGNGQLALDAISRAASFSASNRSNYNLAHLANRTNRPQLAYEALMRLDPDRGPMREWSSYWTQLTHALHLLGRHTEELGAARELERRYPTRKVATSLLARAMAALGDRQGLDSLIRAHESDPGDTYWSLGAAMVVAGEEMLAHRTSNAGREYLERAIDWFVSRPADEAARESHRYWLGSALYETGRFAEAYRIFDDLMSTENDMTYRGMTAVSLARLGQADSARSILAGARSYDIGLRRGFEARLAAIAGDQQRALELLQTSFEHGNSGGAWFHGYSAVDFAFMADSREYQRFLNPVGR